MARDFNHWIRAETAAAGGKRIPGARSLRRKREPETAGGGGGAAVVVAIIRGAISLRESSLLEAESERRSKRFELFV